MSAVLILVVLLALVAWPWLGAVPALLIVCGGLIALLWRERLKLRQLEAWLRDPRPETLPDPRGSWADSYALLARLLRTHHQHERSLSATLQRFRQAGAALPDGLVILGESDEIQWCNPAAEAHLGIDLRKDAGQQITYLIRTPSFVEYLRAENHAEPLTLRLGRDLDRNSVLAIQIIPFEDRQRLLISRDITRIQAVETVRRDFVANVSHELRTPLTVVIGFLETVLDSKDLVPTVARPLKMVMEQAQRMQRLVEDLLTLSRLESAENPPLDEAVNVPALGRKLYEDAMALSANRHRILLALQSSAWVRGSADELRSAFGNLVTNAIRYTPAGGEITLSWRSDGSRACFEVRDTGIGIEAEHLPRVTERFYRVDRSRSRETGGTGLGLAIVKHVATRHGARLEMWSKIGEGSRFSVVFPASRVLPSGGLAPASTDKAA